MSTYLGVCPADLRRLIGLCLPLADIFRLRPILSLDDYFWTQYLTKKLLAKRLHFPFTYRPFYHRYRTFSSSEKVVTYIQNLISSKNSDHLLMLGISLSSLLLIQKALQWKPVIQKHCLEYALLYGNLRTFIWLDQNTEISNFSRQLSFFFANNTNRSDILTYLRDIYPSEFQ